MQQGWRFFLVLLIFFTYDLYSQDHLLLSEIGNGFKKTFVEIHNPTSTVIDLSNLYLTNDTAYYRLPRPDFVPSSGSFLTSFPAASVIPPGETKVIAFYASNFESEFAKKADFELFSSTDDAVADMNPYQGSKLNKFGVPDFIMLFSWDGNSDKVDDIDYVSWSTGVSKVVDKTGKRGANGSQYVDDTPRDQQKIFTYSIDFERLGPIELDEKGGGNGLTGHDETSENMSAIWASSSDPSPGVFSASGRGKASLDQILYDAGTSQQNIKLMVTAPKYFVCEGIKIIIPGGNNGLSWEQSISDIVISGESLDGSENLSVEKDTVIVSNLKFTDEATLEISIDNISIPDTMLSLPLIISTRGLNESFKQIGNLPAIIISESVSIFDIQANYSAWEGKTVTISGIVTIGVNTIQTGRTNVYIQDQSARGINLTSGTVFNNLLRGTQAIITGQVGEYNGVTQIDLQNVNIISTDNLLPAAASLSTGEANNFDRYDGTWIETRGLVESVSTAGTGTNININDGSGTLLIRVWTSTGIDVSGIALGDTLLAYGVPGNYAGSAQLLPSLPEDLTVLKPGIEGDGSGVLTLVSSSTLPSDQTFDIQFKFQAGSYQLSSLYFYPSSGIRYEISNAEVSSSAFTVVAAGHNGFRLDGADIPANQELSISIRNARIVDQMDVSKYIRDAGTSSADTAISVQANQAIPIFAYSSVGGPGSILLPLAANINLKVGSGTRTLIADVQNHFSYYNGKNASISGRMTISAGALRNDQTSAYIQDESGKGINVYDNLFNPELQRGREVTFTGSITDYQGVTELAFTSSSITDTTRYVPRARNLNTYQAASFTEYDGTYAEIRGIIDDLAYAIGGGTNILISDPLGSLTARIWETSEAYLNTDIYTLNLQDSIIARGVIGVYNGTSQLLPAEGNDITSKIAPTPPLELRIPPHPFVPDRGEKLKIEFGAGSKNAHIRLRLFDMQGRQILVLRDQTFSSSKRTFFWDGRDNQGKIIPVGVYILHLEVIDHEGAAKSAKIAPVVIGTKLN